MEEVIIACNLPTQANTRVIPIEALPRRDFQSYIPYFDLSFSLIGKTVDIDHGHKLFSALSYLVPAIHEIDSIAIHTIAGIPDDNGQLKLTKNSRLRIRLSANNIDLVYSLAEKSLNIGTHTVQLGVPQIYPLQPKDKLCARIVVIRPYQQPEPFLAAARRQLEKLGIQGIATIPTDRQGNPKRRSIKVNGFTVVGFTLEVSNLSEEDSLILQRYGIGGKSKMGCGIFVPVKERTEKVLEYYAN
ncbi:MAG: type I-MYXAN CRISPR-associated protein Cas6/Cmx6 [Calothrix sp. FI2-JRJ7]|jgi:CRISPR-associated protein Cas6|nr:type I-MYXAN CRISPR-associated protein Cas6/Cmx6 [Calothrix sp. FI2-JRJ7]